MTTIGGAQIFESTRVLLVLSEQELDVRRRIGQRIADDLQVLAECHGRVHDHVVR